MLQLPEEEFKKIGDMGWGLMEYYYDRETNTIVSEMDHDNHEMDWGAFEAEDLARIKKYSKELQKNEKRYLRIHEPDSKQSYRVMAAFVAQLPEDKYKYKMEAALEGRKPFRNFKDQVDNSPHREAWFAFKDQQERDRNRAYLEMLLEEEE